MTDVKAAKKEEVPAGSMKLIRIGGKEILIANVDGSLHAIGGLCTHMKGDLSRGSLEGKIVTCPRHGAQYDVTTGASVRGPKIGILRLKGRSESSYEIRLEGDDIILSI